MRKCKPTPEDVLAWMEEYAVYREREASKLLLDVSKPTWMALYASAEAQNIRELIDRCRARLERVR